jgi:hypothetical protein
MVILLLILLIAAGMTGTHYHVQIFLLIWDHLNFFAQAGLKLPSPGSPPPEQLGLQCKPLVPGCF